MTDETQGADLSAVDEIDAANPVAEVEAPAQGDEHSGDAAPAATEAGEGKPKPKQSVQERINELTAARREAERDRDFYREQALGRQPPATPAQEARREAPAEEAEPHPDDYEHGELDARFIREHATYHARQTFREEMARTESNKRIQTVFETYQTRTKELFPEGKPAGLEAFERLEVIPQSVNEIVGESDIGPKIAAHLGDNPSELARLKRLSPILQARELTLLETRLSGPARSIPKTATDAPEPPPQARGTGGRFQPSPDTTDFAAFEKLADARG